MNLVQINCVQLWSTIISLSFLGTNPFYPWTPAVTSSSQIMRFFYLYYHVHPTPSEFKAQCSQKTTHVGMDKGEESPYSLLGMGTVVVTMEFESGGGWKTTDLIGASCTIPVYAKGYELMYCRDICILIFITTTYTIVKK